MSSATPLFFGPEHQLFGWYHAPQTNATSTVGVLLCPPLGHEYVCSHRAYRHVAEQLAAAGIPTLRFDYYGTGNSAGGPRDHGVLHQWMESIAAAADELKTQSGTTKIALVGLRLAGTLAMLTTVRRNDLHALVLWEPCISGRSYVRQVKMLGMTNDRAEQLAADMGVEAAGFLLSPATVEDLSALHLTKQPYSDIAVRTLLLQRDDIPADTELAHHLTQHGATVDQQSFAGYASFMRAPIESELPADAIDTIVSWLKDTLPFTSSSKASESDRAVSNCAYVTSEIRESAVSFGTSLFGIFTTPASRSASNTAAIFLNTGGDHHIGPHRLYVPLARDWATRGLGVLRFDLSGLGDSPARDHTSANDSYPSSAIDDIRAAVTYVQRQGYERIVLIGMCSGAYHAIHAAHEGVPVIGTIAVNAPLYSQEDDLRERDPHWHKTEWSHMSRAARSSAPWKRLLTGRANYRRVATILGGRLRSLFLQLLDTVATLFGERDSFVHTNDIARLFPPHVSTHLIFSRDDPGYAYVQLAIGTELKNRNKHLNLVIQIVDDADHTFMPVIFQNQLSTLLTDTVLRLECQPPSR